MSYYVLTDIQKKKKKLHFQISSNSNTSFTNNCQLQVGIIIYKYGTNFTEIQNNHLNIEKLIHRLKVKVKSKENSYDLKPVPFLVIKPHKYTKQTQFEMA